MGHAHHQPQGALHEYIRQVFAFMQAMPAQRQVDGAQYTTRHLYEHRWCWPGGLTLGVPSGRNAYVGAPCRRRAMSSAASRSTAAVRASGTSTLKKIFAAVPSVTAHRPAGQQPAECPAQALPALQPPPGGRLPGSPVPASPTVALFALFSCHNSGKETLGRSKSKSNTHHSQGWLKHTGTRTLRHRPH